MDKQKDDLQKKLKRKQLRVVISTQHGISDCWNYFGYIGEVDTETNEVKANTLNVQYYGCNICGKFILHKQVTLF